MSPAVWLGTDVPRVRDRRQMPELVEPSFLCCTDTGAWHVSMDPETRGAPTDAVLAWPGRLWDLCR